MGSSSDGVFDDLNLPVPGPTGQGAHRSFQLRPSPPATPRSTGYARRKRPKYEAPCAEHPETPQTLPTNAIHANHVEALNASLRRRNSAYRRKTNTYAKKKTGLQRTLDVFWIVHNFIRKHFTTQQVPAVALGILEKGLSWGQIVDYSKTACFRYLIHNQ